MAHRRDENRGSCLRGILPDFGNFYTDRKKELYNPYLGLREFMPWVKKGMSAKACRLGHRQS